MCIRDSYNAHCKNIKATDLDAMVAFAKEEAFDYAVVAQDDPLALGMVDRLADVYKRQTYTLRLTQLF